MSNLTETEVWNIKYPKCHRKIAPNPILMANFTDIFYEKCHFHNSHAVLYARTLGAEHKPYWDNEELVLYIWPGWQEDKNSQYQSRWAERLQLHILYNKEGVSILCDLWCQWQTTPYIWGKWSGGDSGCKRWHIHQQTCFMDLHLEQGR